MEAGMAASMDTGISAKDRASIAAGLSRLLADTHVLCLKTHNFHWNVEGPMFQTLHQMFIDQYTKAWNAIAPIAERIRALSAASRRQGEGPARAGPACAATRHSRKECVDAAEPAQELV